MDIVLPDGGVDASNVYLEGMKGFPNPKCQPTINVPVAQFNLPLIDFFECGVTRVRKWTVSIHSPVLSKHFLIIFENCRERRCFIIKLSSNRKIIRNSSV